MAGNIVITKDGRTYKTVITDVGNEKIARAALHGEKVDVVEAVLTDGGGQYFVPTSDMTALPGNEVWRGGIAYKRINEKSPNMIDVKIFLDGTVGGFTVRGIGLLDSEGDLIALCNTPDIPKVIIEDGIAAPLTFLMHIVVTNADVLEFRIDPSADMVSSEELEKQLHTHNTDPRAHKNLIDSLPTCAIQIVPRFTIPAGGWADASDGSQPPEEGFWPLYQDVLHKDSTDLATAGLNLDNLPSRQTARAAGLCRSAYAGDGSIRFWYKSQPDRDITGTLTVLYPTGPVPVGYSVATLAEARESLNGIFSG